MTTEETYRESTSDLVSFERQARSQRLMFRFHRPTVGLLFLVGLVGTLAATTSHATAPDALKRARELFLQAEADEDADRWSEALYKLRAVSQVRLTAGVRYHLALCEEHLGQLARALKDYRAAADQARVDNAKDVLRTVGNQLAALDPRVPHLIIHVRPQLPDTSIRMDGEPATDLLAGAAVPVDPGVHYIEVRVNDRPVSTQAVVLQEREFRVLELTAAEPPPTVRPTENSTPRETGASSPTAEPPSAAPVSAAPLPAPPPRSPELPHASSPPQHMNRTAAWIATSISVGLGAGGVVAFLVAENRRDYAVRACATKVTTQAGACDDLKTPVRAWDFVAAGVWAAALASGAIAVVLWTKAPRGAGDTGAPAARPNGASVSAVFSPTALGVGGRF
jgi:hypothetical protein